MEGRRASKRKRVSQNTACAACVRHHRACDKSLPCTRCIEKGVAHLCATPIKAPRFIYANVAADTFTGKRCTRRPQAQVSHTTSEGATRSQKEKDRAQLLVTILRDVRRLNEATTALERQQDTFKRQLSALRAGNNHRTPTISATERYPPESNSKILQDNLLIAESAFLPFVIDDPLKPFVVFKPVVQDWDLFNSVVWGGAEGIFNDTYTSLAAFARIQKLILHCSPAFCDMLHYTEEELQADEIRTVKVNWPTNVVSDALTMLCSLIPQPGTSVSGLIPRNPTLRARDGHLIRGTLKLQYFYDEAGYVSFGVGVMQDFVYVGREEERSAVSHWDALCNALEELRALVRNETSWISISSPIHA